MKRFKRFRPLLILLLFVSPVLINLLESHGHENYLLGSPLPSFDVPLLDGSVVSLSQETDRPVILNFWATWCVPCRVEMPLLQGVHDSGEAIVLAVNNAESPQKIQRFLTQYDVQLPVVLDPDGLLQTEFDVLGYPTTLFVNPDGIVYRVHNGPLTEDDLTVYLDPSRF